MKTIFKNQWGETLKIKTEGRKVKVFINEVDVLGRKEEKLVNVIDVDTLSNNNI